ncbi:hypothetical protein CVT24_003643 [Panaeolus cyanescens]|uniref:Uncharacterized protein n=1 Tax=Panaeolus cyanescens TaxID=181874 RepID=A0A409Y862_9AGAR|nr:hypothetical protein CVT24_003643 [Panaeolus cyanescens]
MSIFQRPESPPPRAPSPELPPAPLPYPHHARRVPSQPRIRVQTPTVPPGLQVRPKGLHSVRSCDNIYARNVDSLQTSKARTRSAMMLSPSDTPNSSPSSSARNSSEFTPGHRRTSSVAIQRPATSPISTYPPLPMRHVYLPDIHSERPNTIQSQSQPKLASKPVILPPLEKHKNLGAACLKLFRFRPSKQQQRSPIVSM